MHADSDHSSSPDHRSRRNKDSRESGHKTGESKKSSSDTKKSPDSSGRGKKTYAHSFWQQLVIVGKSYGKADGTLKANALTYQTLLALVPMITLLVVSLSYIPALDSAKNQIKQVIYSSLLPSSTQQIMQYLDDFAANSSNITLVGFILLLYTGVSLLDATEKVFNSMWGVHHPRQNLLGSLKYWLVLVTGPLLIGIAFLLYSAISSMHFLNANFSGYSIDWDIWLQIGAFIFLILGLALVYWLIPSCQVPFREALLAGLIVGVILELVRASFSGLISSFSSYNKIYGAFAAIPIFFLWVNLTWNIILLGVEFTIVRTYDRVTHKSYSSIIDALVYILSRFEEKSLEGKSLNQYEVRHALGHPQLLSWSHYTNILLENGVIREYNAHRYHLNVALEDISLSDLLGWLDYPDKDEDKGKLNQNTSDHEQEEQAQPLPDNPSLKKMAVALRARPLYK